jgi:hypothetical protein
MCVFVALKKVLYEVVGESTNFEDTRIGGEGQRGGPVHRDRRHPENRITVRCSFVTIMQT